MFDNKLLIKNKNMIGMTKNILNIHTIMNSFIYLFLLFNFIYIFLNKVMYFKIPMYYSEYFLN